MSWMIPDDRLDVDQRQVINISLQARQSILIEGPAGSGKSVILVKILQNILLHQPAKQVCMVLFTRSLMDMMKSGIPDPLSSQARIYSALEFQRNQIQQQWDVVIVDEVQDLKQDLLDQIFHCAKQVILAGDRAQAIYEEGCSSSDFDRMQNLQTLKLKKIYRLPKSIQRIAGHFADDAEFFSSYEVDQRVANVSIQLMPYPDPQREVQEVWRKAREYAWNQLSAVVIYPTNEAVVEFCTLVLAHEHQPPWQATYRFFRNNKRLDYESLNNYLKQRQVQLQVMGGGSGSMQEADARNLVSVMTYHSAKGLDFDAVFLPRLTQEITFWRTPDIARRMFFVALTRSRRNLFLSYHGQAHEFVDRIPRHLLSFQKFTEHQAEEARSPVIDVIDF